MFAAKCLLGLDFWPNWSSFVGLGLLGVSAWLSRDRESRFVLFSSILVCVVALFIFIDPQTRCFVFTFTGRGLTLNYVMPLAILTVALPTLVVLVVRRLRDYARNTC